MQPISKLPAASSPPPVLPSGAFKLYRDSSWSSPSLQLSINDYQSGQRQSLSGSSLQDRATWVAFNLPVGVVVTLANNVVAQGAGPAYNLSGLAQVADLVGTGQTESVWLSNTNMQDKVSSFFWRRVDLSMGAIEIFENANYSGNRTVIFLSEWPSNQPISLTGWYISDRASSIIWSSFPESTTAALYDNSNGSGASYANMKGWGSFTQLADLSQAGFNDKASSFSWSAEVPMKEIIDPIKIPMAGFATTGDGLVQTAQGTNNSSAAASQSITVSKTAAQTTTLTVTNQYMAGTTVTSTFSEEESIGIGNVGGKTTYSLSVALQFQYTRTNTTTKTTTTTTDVSVTQTYVIPPYSSFSASLIVHMGVLPANTTYSTTATRWYTDQLPGSVFDSTTGWYKRVETVTFQLSGSMACGTDLSIKATPLPGH